LRLELSLDSLGVGVSADALDRSVGLIGDAGLEGLLDVFEEDGAEGAELLLDDLDLAHEGLEDAVLFALRVEEVMTAHLGRRLQRAVDAAVALLEAGGVPGEVEVEEIGAVGLEVDAF